MVSEKRLLAGIVLIAAGFFCHDVIAQIHGAPPPLSGNEVVPLVSGSGRNSALVSDISKYVTSAGGAVGGTPAAISAAGSNQGTAASVTSSVTVVTSVSASQGVILTLPYSSIINAGANTLSVYPSAGGTITYQGTSLGTNTAATIAAGSQASFACTTTTTCYEAASSFQ